MKAAIFDMDGTLLDSMDMWNRALPTLIDYHKIVPDEKFFKDTHLMSLRQIEEYVLTRYSLPYTIEEMRAFWNGEILRQYIETVRVKDGVVEYLKKLRAEGVKTCVATLTEHSLTDVVLSKKGLSQYMDFILTYEDSNGVGKERPDLFLKCADLMGAEPSECMVFEDSLYPVEPAKKAGFKVTAVEDPVMYKSKEKLMAQSDRYIKSFKELL